MEACGFRGTLFDRRLLARSLGSLVGSLDHCWPARLTTEAGSASVASSRV